MAKDERLLPLPTAEVQLQTSDFPTTYAPVYDADPFAEKRSIREYVNVVLKRKWMILAIITIVTLSTAIYVYRLPSVYQSQAQVLIESRPPSQQKDKVNINFWYDAKYWETQVKMIQNPDLMRDAVVALGLHRNQNLFGEQAGPGLFSAVGGMLTGSKAATNNDKTGNLPVLTNDVTGSDLKSTSLSPEEEKRAEEYARVLVNGLSVEPVERTNLVNLKFTHTNPQLAVAIPNAVAKVFIQKDTERQMQGAVQATEDNAKQIAELQQKINELEQQRVNYLQAADLPLRQNGENLIAQRLMEYSQQWLKAEETRRRLQSQFEAAQRAKASGNIYNVPEVSENEAVRKVRELNLVRKADLEKRIEGIEQKIEELKGKREQLLVRYQPEWHEVKAIDEQIKSWEQTKEKTSSEVNEKIKKDEQQMAREAETEVLTGMRARYEAAAKQENQARAAYLSERSAANVQGQSEVKLTTLMQEIESNRKLLDSALLRQKDLEIDADSSRPDNITIATKAEGAGLVGPNRSRTVLIAFLISFAAGVGLAFLLDYLDDSIKSSDDVGRHLGLPTLALIPHNSLDKPGARNRLAAIGNNGTQSNALVALDDSRSALAEAYRHLRTSLLFSSAGKPPQTILITSSQPSEGKTTTAINTAITLAQAGAEVVLIDCDLRRPRLHHHFQLDNMHGLTNFLSGERNTGALLKPVDRLPNLKVITSGPIPPNPAELLSSNEMRNIIEFLRGNFKHVIIDSPPAISFTDAAILSTLVDGVVIVAMAGKSSIHLIRRFKQRLNAIGARIYGVVLNGLKKNSLDYGYYGYGYSYYYNYYNDNEQEENGSNGNGKHI